MPTYEYGCHECGHRFEQVQKISDDPLVTCPSCGKDAIERIISAAAFMLKGGGWSSDNYNRNPGAPKRTEKQIEERLQKAVSDDQKKTAAATKDSSSGTSGSST